MKQQDANSISTLPVGMQRMEIDEDGHTGYLTYSIEGGTLRIWYVEVPSALQGRGLGGTLVRKAFVFANEHSLKVEAICSFAASYITRNPDLKTTPV
jgi:predicted GNAT family acetyltransferase